MSARAVLGILVPRAYETTHREVKPWTGSTSSRFSVPWIFPFRFTLLLSCVKPKFTSAKFRFILLFTSGSDKGYRAVRTVRALEAKSVIAPKTLEEPVAVNPKP